MLKAALRSAIVVISDRVVFGSGQKDLQSHDAGPRTCPNSARKPAVIGGYLERLPLAAVHEGYVDFAEIWHHTTEPVGTYDEVTSHLARRVFPLAHVEAPFQSETMLEFIRRHGAPRILCVWGLGVSETILELCADSVIVYNSIDAPSLRVPPEISRHFDLVLTGAQWQSDDVNARHPQMPTAIIPVGPEFASPETFFPLEIPKIYDVIYVAAAQAYKRHDLLFAALAQAPRRLKALCVMGYGENADVLRRQASELGLDVDFIGPPGVDYPEVNRLMNLAKVGVVCGRDDGAPAILTEYMLAGLPVVANADLACGLQFILPKTGLVASEDHFAVALMKAIDHPEQFAPRQAVLDRWAWPRSISRLKPLLRKAAPRSSSSSSLPEGGIVDSTVLA
ncbi:glycosyltransferase [Devosia sp. MC521]|uniref:glycosyltransferase n=1 Tax=Devosia sp. MC521 TaxID=2759954 RepID=UPI0015FBCF06|nr:glycosyltransferase [Devosia sp. MC521]MBJ6986079.1 glycosyltransferase family 4 protein [Devosia sp. MC521]QMW61448.1 glycosyltransferase family 4 protein [Devosia sp. MC521]